MKQLLTCLLLASTVSAAIPPVSTYDSDARAWAKNKIPSVTNTVSDLDYAVTTELLNFMKTRGLRSKVKRMQLYAPSCGLQSMRYPVIADTGPVGVTDSDNIQNFVEGDYTTTGLTGNGSSKLISTSLKLGSFGSVYNLHFGVYNRTSGTISGVEIGNGEGSSIAQIAVNYTGAGTIWQSCAASYVLVTESSGVGCYMGSVTASDFAGIYKNGGLWGSFTNPGCALPDWSVFVYARNYSGVTDQYSSRQLCFYTIGLAINPDMTLYYYRAVQFAQRRWSRAL